MADRKIVFDLIARDRASAAFNKVGKSTDGLKGKVRDFGTGFKDAFSPASVASVGAMGAAVAGFGIASVKAFADSEAQQKKLSNAFEKFPQLAGANADALRKLNEQLALTTVYDDDVTASAQAVLASFGLTEQQLRTITPLLQDYATRTGKDLPLAAQDLGRAMAGQGRALKAIGIDFTDAGSTAANFDQVVAGLRKQVGGFAENEGNTLDGKLAILNNRFGELQEKIGEKLLPALVSITDWAVNVGIPALEGLVAEIQKYVDVIVQADKLLKKYSDKVLPGKKDDGFGLGDVGKFLYRSGIPIPWMDAGGVMPGPRGKHDLAWVAGGETVLPTHKTAAPGLPVGATVNATYNISAGDLPSSAALEMANRDLGWRLSLAGGI